MWPLIKNKVKDPTIFVKNCIAMDDGDSPSSIEDAFLNRSAQKSFIKEELEKSTIKFKKAEHQLREELRNERERRRKAEKRNEVYKKRI
jgi:hypothetical protein